MVTMFERRFGVKYPWARYDQLLVRNFGAGGMENTSATSMHPGAVYDPIARKEQDLDGLISHELCHQWTGDLITCKSWEHIWLNEGWATYGSTLWLEERDGQDGYYDGVLGSAGVARRDTTEAEQPMCSPIYENAGETFSRLANPYPKGASILHMLRRMLGEEVFWKGVKLYMTRHAGGLAETSDFRYAMEEASGLGLEWFFDQWCYRPGSPKLKTSASYDAATRMLTVNAEQTQKIDARTPAMRISIPVWVRTASGERTIPFEMRNKSAQLQVQLDGPPQALWVDPWLETLKTIQVEQPQEWTIAVLHNGPTIAARRQAMVELGTSESAAAREALTNIANDRKARHTLRSAAVEVLADYKSPAAQQAVLALVESANDDPRVLADVTTALRSCKREDAVPKLKAFLAPVKDGGTEGYGVRSAAIASLLALDASDCLPLIRRQVAYPSGSASVSQAALRALEKWGDASDVELVKSRAALGIPDRARPQALDTLAAMAPRLDAATRAKVEEFCIALLEDPEGRTANGAGDALAAMKCKAALPRLKAMAERDGDPSKKSRAERWVAAIEGTASGSAGGAPTRAP
jgi:aminopeptidase N